MLELSRYKGKLIRQKMLKKRLNFVSDMKKAKEKKRKEIIHETSNLCRKCQLIIVEENSVTAKFNGTINVCEEENSIVQLEEDCHPSENDFFDKIGNDFDSNDHCSIICSKTDFDVNLQDLNVREKNSTTNFKEDSDVNLKIENTKLCEGCRIVELKELGKRLKCCVCDKTLSLENIEEERRFGLNSRLSVKCESCLVLTQVWTNRKHVTKNNNNHSNINTNMVLGCIHAGLGHTALNKILACSNIPPISADLFKRHEREVGPVIESTAKESCKKAALEERQLVVANMAKLCIELPSEMVDDLYPHYKTLLSSTTTIKSASELENLETKKNNDLNFDIALGEIVNIIVSYDMGWSKRGNGRSYDSLNGYAAIIGFLSSKVLDYMTCTRKCKFCDRGHKKEDHDCRKNFEGSAKAMEPAAGASLMNHSAILKEQNLCVRGMVGDEDSSTILAVRHGATRTIHKLSDKNHLMKEFNNDLYSLQSQYKEMKNKKTITHLKKCFSYAVAQNKGKSSELAKTLRSIPDHVFNQRQNCGDWCHSNSDSDSSKQTIILKNPELYNKLKIIFFKYAANAPKFSITASSQANESLNNIMAHKAPKNQCYSLTESADFRYASAVCDKNEGQSYLLDVKKNLTLSPGKHTCKFVEKRDEIKRKRATKAVLPSSKRRRTILTENRSNLRKKMEKSEGVQYQSNVGLLQDENDLKLFSDCQDFDTNSVILSITSKTCNLVFFDLETSGFSKHDEILQIGAQFKDHLFSVYITPTKPLNPEASKHTGLKFISGKLYFHHEEVDSIPLEDALDSFRQFLNFSSKPCVLVAHNASFDSSFLIRAILHKKMIQDFHHIAGFCDTFVLFKQCFPQRKGEGKFKLETLAEDFATDELDGSFHEALYDVRVLKSLTSKFLNKKDLYQTSKSFADSVKRVLESHDITIRLRHLEPLKNVLTNTMLKKLAKERITYEMLLAKFNEEGEDGLLEFLKEKKKDGKPRFTKNQRILNSLVTFFNQKKIN